MTIPQYVPTARCQIQRMPLTNLLLFLHHWLLLGSGFLSGIPLWGGQVLLRWGWWFFVIIKRFIIVKWSFRHMSTRSAVFGWNVHLLSMFLIHNKFFVISIFFYKSWHNIKIHNNRYVFSKLTEITHNLNFSLNYQLDLLIIHHTEKGKQ